jgi:hypothetical protein
VMNPVIVVFLGISPEAWSAIGTITVSVVAVLIALFQERISRYHRRAHVDMRILAEDFQGVQFLATKTQKLSGATGLAVYIRVQNISTRPALAVEIGVNSVLSLKDGRAVTHFFPLSLTVTSIRPKRTLTYIPPESARYFDLGYLRSAFAEEADSLPPQAADGVFFWFDTPFRQTPAPGELHPYQLQPGKYEVELLLTGENVKSLRKRWQMEFRDCSPDDEEVMRQSIRFVELGHARTSRRT